MPFFMLFKEVLDDELRLMIEVSYKDTSDSELTLIKSYDAMQHSCTSLANLFIDAKAVQKVNLIPLDPYYFRNHSTAELRAMVKALGLPGFSDDPREILIERILSHFESIKYYGGKLHEISS